MQYYDDILNVYAYLQSKTKANLLTSKTLIAQYQELDKTIHGLNQQADELLSQACTLAVEMGVDISDIAAKSEKPLSEFVENECVEPSQLLINLPGDFDFQKDFQRLCEEAHTAGFIDVHPEELLSAEEMQRAEAINRELDLRFLETTGLKKKDAVVLTIAVMMRMVCFFMYRKIDRFQLAKESQPVENSNGYAGKNIMRNMDIMNAVDLGCETKQLRSHLQILQEHTPFDVSDNTLFQHKDIIGFDKRLGWFFGVLNILTNTVTTYKLKSYSVIQPAVFSMQPYIDREISILPGIVMPVWKNALSEKNAIIAAVIKEASVLNYCNMNLEQINELFRRAVELDERNSIILEKTKSVLSSFKAEWVESLGGIEVNSFLNTIIAAIHAVLYDESDGSIDMYAIRTNKIIIYSSAMSTIVNSLPAIANEDVRSVDFAGMITTCLGWFHSTRFWVEAKSNFLVSEYKKEIDKEMNKVNRYFIFE